jgi:hypothetical protein
MTKSQSAKGTQHAMVAKLTITHRCLQVPVGQPTVKRNLELTMGGLIKYSNNRTSRVFFVQV